MNFRLSPYALRNLEEIGFYTLENWDILQADKYLELLDEAFQRLSKNPYIGYVRNDIKQGYYSYPEGSHIIYYRIKNNFVEIMAILHEKMDAKRYL